MALDRFIYWNNAERPAPDEIMDVLQHFLGGFAQRIERSSNGCIATLVGNHSEMFETTPGIRGARASDERWIELFFSDDALDIITRRQDDATNALATHFAERVAKAFDGRLEMG